MVSEIATEQLVKTRLLACLSEPMLHQLARAAESRIFRAGQVLFHEGAICRELFLLTTGKVQLNMRVPGHGIIPILTVGPGQMVAWSAILGHGEMTTSALALEDTQAIALPFEKIMELCEQDHDFGYRFMRCLAGELARRLVATRLQLLDLFANESPMIPLEKEDHA